MNYDVFVSHASEDKAEVARPIAQKLTERGLDVWYDEFKLKAGDSISDSIAHGLYNSRFGVVILSHSYFRKPWAKHEFRGLTAIAVYAKRKIIVPVWHQVQREDVEAFDPSLADAFALSTEPGCDHVVDRLVAIVRPDVAATTISQARRLCDSGYVVPAVVSAASLLEERLRDHAVDRLSYDYFRKLPIKRYGLGPLIQVLRAKGYLPGVRLLSEADFDSIVRTRNNAVHRREAVSFAQATRLIDQVEVLLAEINKR